MDRSMLPELSRLSRSQHGVITRRQARDAGLSPKAIRCRLEAGRWQRVHPGVYLTHGGPLSWSARASAALLWAGRGAVLTLTAAAHVWGLSERPPAVIAVGIPLGRRVVRPAGVRVRRRQRLDRRFVDRLAVTSPEQTVVDLAAEAGWDPDDAVALAARAVRAGRTDAAGLLAELRARRAHPMRSLLGVALGDVASGVESVAEFRFVRDVLRAHGLPRLACQTAALPVAPGAGGATGGRAAAVGQAAAGRGSRRDFESPEHGVVVEIDGQLWHSGDRFHEDRRRDRAAARDGKVTLRATWFDVASRPCELALDVGLTLARRGWRGRPVPCGDGCPVARAV